MNLSRPDAINHHKVRGPCSRRASNVHSEAEKAFSAINFRPLTFDSSEKGFCFGALLYSKLLFQFGGKKEAFEWNRDLERAKLSNIVKQNPLTHFSSWEELWICVEGGLKSGGFGSGTQLSLADTSCRKCALLSRWLFDAFLLCAVEKRAHSVHIPLFTLLTAVALFCQ